MIFLAKKSNIIMVDTIPVAQLQKKAEAAAGGDKKKGEGEVPAELDGGAAKGDGKGDAGKEAGAGKGEAKDGKDAAAGDKAGSESAAKQEQSADTEGTGEEEDKKDGKKVKVVCDHYRDGSYSPYCHLAKNYTGDTRVFKKNPASAIPKVALTPPEPQTDQNELQIFVQNLKKVYQEPMEGSLLVGHAVRYLGTCALYTYIPIVFGMNFPENKAEYSTLSAVLVAGFGMTTSILEGLISDRFEARSPWTNSILNIG